jgi:hypothetical protein
VQRLEQRERPAFGGTQSFRSIAQSARRQCRGEIRVDDTWVYITFPADGQRVAERLRGGAKRPVDGARAFGC